MQYDRAEGIQRNRAFVTLVILCIGVMTATVPVSAQGSVQRGAGPVQESVSVPIVDAGTRVDLIADDASWNRKVLVASPSIRSGDVDVVNGSIRDASTKCALTIMASVSKSNDQQRYELKHIGVGYSVQGAAGRIVISSDKAAEFGISLGFIARQVLRTNEQQLAKVMLIGKTSLLALFDAPSVMNRGGTHRKYVTRHLVYVDPYTGGGAMMTWLLVPPDDQEHPLAIINQPIRVTKWGADETRNIHVDGNEFNFLGVPGELAFALEDLPPGRDVVWTQRAASLAGLESYSVAQLSELSDAMNEAMSGAMIQQPEP